MILSIRNIALLIQPFLIVILIQTLYAESYEDKLKELLEKLHRDGYKVTYFADKRFKIYEDTSVAANKLNKADYFAPSFGIFTEVSFTQSLDFIDKYRISLQKAETIYNVDKEYIVAILQMETNFGRKSGKRLVLDALSSMYVHGRKWMYGEIKIFLSLEGKLYKDPFEIKGSYAGAFGAVQSLPSSYRIFGVDFNNDVKIDPYCLEDSIGFVANYLKKCGFSKTLESKRGAIYSYNRQKSYVNTAVSYVKELKERQQKKIQNIAN